MNEAHNCVIQNCSFLLIPSVSVLRGKECQDSLCSLIHFTFLYHATGWSQILFVINAQAIVVRLLMLTLFVLLRSLFSLGTLAECCQYKCFSFLLEICSLYVHITAAVNFSKQALQSLYAHCHSEVLSSSLFNVILKRKTLKQVPWRPGWWEKVAVLKDCSAPALSFLSLFVDFWFNVMCEESLLDQTGNESWSDVYWQFFNVFLAGEGWFWHIDYFKQCKNEILKCQNLLFQYLLKRQLLLKKWTNYNRKGSKSKQNIDWPTPKFLCLKHQIFISIQDGKTLWPLKFF